MNKTREEDDDDFISDDEIDEHEYEISATSNRPINWRRIELLKEKMWLKQQIEDYDDWYHDEL